MLYYWRDRYDRDRVVTSSTGRSSPGHWSAVTFKIEPQPPKRSFGQPYTTRRTPANKKSWCKKEMYNSQWWKKKRGKCHPKNPKYKNAMQFWLLIVPTVQHYFWCSTTVWHSPCQQTQIYPICSLVHLVNSKTHAPLFSIGLKFFGGIISLFQQTWTFLQTGMM